jgi:ribosomal protein S18 acetylase RimI-like enzyme
MWPVVERAHEQLESIPAGPGREAFMPLLLLADDSEQEVRSYYQQGDLSVLWGSDGHARGITLAIPKPDGSVELKAVAVAPELHGQGVGKRMLALVLAELRARGVRHVIVGTANSGIGQLAFYQKAGFRLWKIERDFFTPARGYLAGIEENGIPLRDMVWMDQTLE